MRTLRDNLAVVGFIVTTIGIAVMYWLLGQKNRKISELLYEIQKEELEDKLRSAQEEVRKDGELNAQALAHYHTLLSRYGALAKKLGVRTPRSDAGRDGESH
jgi:molybdopterin synthase catalytic subunit